MPVTARNHQNHKAIQPLPLSDPQTASEIQEPFAAIAHDAHNVLAALQIYSDLLAEPGVLSDGYRHFASDLKTIVASNSGLVQKLTMLSGSDASLPQSTEIDDLPLAVERMKGPLSALAGQNIALEMECLPAYGRIRLSEEDLARILINLTRNAAEAMPHGGRIRITVQRGGGGNFFEFLDEQTNSISPTALLCVQDFGPGIPKEQINQLFDAGFTTKQTDNLRRGLGLYIVRRLVTAAGGTVRVVSALGRGTRFEVELPLIGCDGGIGGFHGDFTGRRNLEC